MHGESAIPVGFPVEESCKEATATVQNLNKGSSSQECPSLHEVGSHSKSRSGLTEQLNELTTVSVAPDRLDQ